MLSTSLESDWNAWNVLASVEPFVAQFGPHVLPNPQKHHSPFHCATCKQLVWGPCYACVDCDSLHMLCSFCVSSASITTRLEQLITGSHNSQHQLTVKLPTLLVPTTKEGAFLAALEFKRLDAARNILDIISQHQSEWNINRTTDVVTPFVSPVVDRLSRYQTQQELDFIIFLVKKHNLHLLMTGHQGWTVLHLIARDGNANLLSFLLENGAKELIDTKANGLTPLFTALVSDSRPAARVLIERGGADPNKRVAIEMGADGNETRISPFEWTVLQKMEGKPTEMARLLRTLGGQLHYPLSRSGRFSVSEGGIYVMDPCHQKPSGRGTWGFFGDLGVAFPNAISGEWLWSMDFITLPTQGECLKSLAAWHERSQPISHSIRDDEDENACETPFNVSVDDGRAMVISAMEYDEFCDAIPISSDVVAVTEEGGYGVATDAAITNAFGYPVYAATKDGALTSDEHEEITSIRIVFLTELGCRASNDNCTVM
ncbi:hypothetical protein BJ742DRAFT_154341 [Cladochytrium replicatum]|nr:hypothetical protein BJ742DRAFT_154341 [Cladochytrium replicatum]